MEAINPRRTIFWRLSIGWWWIHKSNFLLLSSCQLSFCFYRHRDPIDGKVLIGPSNRLVRFQAHQLRQRCRLPNSRTYSGFKNVSTGLPGHCCLIWYRGYLSSTWRSQEISQNVERSPSFPSADRYLAATVDCLLLGYSTLASTTLKTLNCVPIQTSSRFFYDGNIPCWQWWQKLCGAVLCVFIVPFVFVQYRGSKLLYRKEISAKRFLYACLIPLPFAFRWMLSCKKLPPPPVKQTTVMIIVSSYLCFQRIAPSEGNPSLIQYMVSFMLLSRNMMTARVLELCTEKCCYWSSSSAYIPSHIYRVSFY